jgi:histidine triad (HIT) family protein
MATIFTRIIEGEIPSRMLWEDSSCVSFLDVRPLSEGHALVVPRVEIDKWTDLPTDLAAHLMTVAHAVGTAQMAVFGPARVGLMIAGFEVPHTHVHVVPMNSMAQLDFGNATTDPDSDVLDRHHELLRAQLREDGHTIEG